jgi:DNA invertase Pin-like site-specific DNA recombinase
LANIRQLEDAGVRFVALTQGIDVKPGGDAMSRLTLTMLAAVAEFERDLIRERTLLGLAKAQREGQRLGRPPEKGPARSEVLKLRRKLSWSEVAQRLGCTVAMARRKATS